MESIGSDLPGTEQVPGCKQIVCRCTGNGIIPGTAARLFSSDATQAYIRHNFFNVSKEIALLSVRIVKTLPFL